MLYELASLGSGYFCLTKLAAKSLGFKIGVPKPVPPSSQMRPEEARNSNLSKSAKFSSMFLAYLTVTLEDGSQKSSTLNPIFHGWYQTQSPGISPGRKVDYTSKRTETSGARFGR